MQGGHPESYSLYHSPPSQTHTVGGFNFPAQPTAPFTIKIPSPMQLRNRTSLGSAHSAASGSEYHESNASMDLDGAHEEDAEGEDEEPEPEKVYGTSMRGRRVTIARYKESDSEPDPLATADYDEELNGVVGADFDEEEAPRPATRRLRSRPNPVVLSSDEGESGIGRRYATRSQSKKPDPPKSSPSRRLRRGPHTPSSHMKTHDSRRPGLRSRRTGPEEDDADGYIDVDQPNDSADDSMEDAVPEASSDLVVNADDDADAEGEIEANGEEDEVLPSDGKPYALRQRVKVNYAIPPPLDEIPVAPPKPTSARHGGGRTNWNRSGSKKGPGWSVNGAELSRFLGLPGEDSDSDAPTRGPRKGFGNPAFTGGLNGLLPGDLAAAAGTPANFGKVGDAALADADPLGVNQNVTFDEVGGLDDHINSLKEMTLLPLLYPEVFQRFGLTPPRGVLFHGPPGTGKTLLARALAASCRSNGKGISFFMRKGADVLSKWVGEAERQLRLLFEEARNCQPSIIFFDEIDGLAPVRSSKQDQIHASIVSTLLALMDGMDGRGQVVVIGATNRPDAVDPALRRPGRFDREFYFPLPTFEARKKILRIMTKKWAGWEGEKGEEQVGGLANLTKGYGGADLRALCTEAALNAVQRRYPQIYRSNDRLLLKPETIEVELRDFMISVKKLVPSSARSSASVAAPLPSQLVPLLSEALDKVKAAIDKVMPISKKRTALEEAEWEDDGQEGGLEREVMLQSMETLRVYRPRIIIHGPVGVGQNYIGTAALHHLEGYHVQNLDLGTLLSDSTRTSEAAIVQLFVEAKRHQPSIIYIPSLLGWSSAVSETCRSTVHAMLETLAPTDPVLLLAVVDGSYMSLPRDVRAWFGPTRDNRIEVTRPCAAQREAFFEGLLKDIQRPPNQFPDGLKRRRRILEELPLAPPIEPRQPSATELAMQQENDHRLLTLLRYRLGPILTELKRKFKRFTKPATEEYRFPVVGQVSEEQSQLQPVDKVTTTVDFHQGPNGVLEIVEHTELVNGAPEALPEQIVPPLAPPSSVAEQQCQVPQLYNMDLERMHVELHKNRYLTPQDFLSGVGKIVHNAVVCQSEDLERLHRAQAMYTATEVSIQDFDPQFRAECERMAVRERQRRADRKKEKAKAKEQGIQEADAGSETYAPGTRRSARHNGQEPEIAITDVTKLERAARQKRQRSTGPSTGSQASGDETNDGRNAKRSRVNSEDVSMNMNLPEPCNSGQVSSVYLSCQEPTPNSVNSNGNGGLLPDVPPSAMGGGFDPSLLNPAPSPPDQSSYRRFFSTSSTPVGPPPDPMTVDARPSRSPSPVPLPPQPEMPPSSETHPNSPPLVSNADPHPNAAHTVESPAPAPPAPERDVEPIEVDREPTPLPDFYVNQNELTRLRDDLRDKTDLLSVEQLEQLRASCLGLVWARRSDWHRDDLILALGKVLRDFVDEVQADHEDEMLVSPVAHNS
ncbi:AAA-domain-containing protein [Russula earlei]|uniref:AAA-domain-containing protein n=1 Tax=Russula earlei TaxID=71964 RepID=A0ACC0UM39_9AGAM|nr:AAA-domain-containing protein [Russula earlei]